MASLSPDFLKNIAADFFILILNQIFQVLENWWWLILFFALFNNFLFFWLWWLRERWIVKQKSILLEIRMPRDIIKPIRAMEGVMANIHQSCYQPPDWWEKWIEGQIQLSVSFEMISTEGEPHFFIRIHHSYRDAVEASVYSQYPEVEIKEAED